MKSKLLMFSFIYLLSYGGIQESIAEEIIIGVGQQGSSSLKQQIPTRGLSRDEVTQVYGEPVSRTGPTGHPPIETWHYDYFSVYFESDRVIHSVLKHVRQDALPEQASQ